jgi:hypothetical protein
MSDYVEMPAFELPPEGTSDAICVAWLDLGSYKNHFADQPPKPGQPPNREYVRKLMLVFELVGSADAQSQPFLLAEVWTKTLAKNSTMAARFAGWGLKPEVRRLPLSQILGRPALVSVIHKTTNQGRIFPHIQSLLEWPRNRSAPKSIRPLYSWDIDTAAALPDADWLPFALGRPVAEMIRESLEWRVRATQKNGATATASTAPIIEGEVPF